MPAEGHQGGTEPGGFDAAGQPEERLRLEARAVQLPQCPVHGQEEAVGGIEGPALIAGIHASHSGVASGAGAPRKSKSKMRIKIRKRIKSRSRSKSRKPPGGVHRGGGALRSYPYS